MKKSLVFTVVIISFLVISEFSFDIISEAANSPVASDFTGAQSDSISKDTFNFKQALFGNASSLALWVEEVNNSSGVVTLNGVDSRTTTGPFTWYWGDENVTTGWFPQTHTYADKARDYIVTVVSQYPNGDTGSAEALVAFVPPEITTINLSSSLTVAIPDHVVNLTSRTDNPGYSVNLNLTYFGDDFFGVVNRSTAKYILTAAASIQMDFANNNVNMTNGDFKQVILRDPTFGGGYAVWYTDPACIVAGDSFFNGTIQWSSLFHEMGHDVTLNSPSNFSFGGKIDGNANAIYSEAMAQIFQMATAYELINSAQKYGISSDIIFNVEQSAYQTTSGLRRTYEDYVDTGMHFSSWNSPATENDTFDTFMTLAYIFGIHAEESGLGYRIPLERMMSLLQTFGENDLERYSPTTNSPAAETFRATLMVAALSYGFEEDLRTEFRNLNFPVSDEIYTELIERMKPQLTVSISPTSAAMGIGQSQLFISNLFAGCPPYTYQWYLNGEPVSGANGDSWTFTPISAGSYLIYLKVADVSNVTSNSSIASISVTSNKSSTTGLAPGPVTGLIVTKGEGEISLEWSLSATGGAPTAIMVYRSTNSTIPSSPIASLSGAATGYADNNVTNGATYYYWIIPSNAHGSGTITASGAISLGNSTVLSDNTNDITIILLLGMGVLFVAGALAILMMWGRKNPPIK